MTSWELRTRRLRLTPLTPALLRAQLDRNPRFFQELSAIPRDDWPPPLYDDDALRWTLGRLEQGDDPRWHIRVVALRRRLLGRAKLIGVAGFKGPPDDAGEVEIGYSIVASEQRRGYGAEAVDALLTFAFEHRHVAFVSAHTLDGEQTIASRRVLERAGFAGPFPTEDFGVVRYELARESL